MKKYFINTIIMFAALLQLPVLKAKAQANATHIPENGYWVLVSNKHVKKVTTVQFYNTDDQLIYQEEVYNQKININRLKTLRCLKKGLDSALFAWERQKLTLYDKNWMAINLRQR